MPIAVQQSWTVLLPGMCSCRNFTRYILILLTCSLAADGCFYACRCLECHNVLMCDSVVAHFKIILLVVLCSYYMYVCYI